MAPPEFAVTSREPANTRPKTLATPVCGCSGHASSTREIFAGLGIVYPDNPWAGKGEMIFAVSAPPTVQKR